MSTELELRAALAARADDCQAGLDQAQAAIVARLSRAPRAWSPRRGRVALAGVVVAATVAVAAVAPAVIHNQRHGVPAAPAPVTSDQIAAPADTATTPATPTRVSTATPPGTARAVAPLVTSPPPRSTTVTTSASASQSPGRVTAVTVTNLISVAIKRSVLWDMRSDVEYLYVQMPDNKHVTISAFPPAAGFTTSRISQAEPVTVAGTPGWFGSVSTWPADGRPDPTTGKQNAPVPSMAWQLGSTWVVVQSDDPDVTSSTKLAALAGTMGITNRPPDLRLPFEVAYLPKDFTVTSYGFFEQGPGDLIGQSWGATLTAGSTTLDIALRQPSETDSFETADHSKRVTRSGPAGYVLQAAGVNVPEAQLRKLLDHTTLAPHPTVRGPGWPLLRTALP